MFGDGKTTGGDLGQFQTLTMLMYDNAFGPRGDYGYGSAIAWTLFLIIIAGSLINLLLVRRVRSA